MIGIEISPSLAAIARRNVTDYRPPPPLQAPIEIVESPRRVTLAYLSYTAAVAPVTEMLSSFGWLTLSRYEQSLRGHYNWLIYSN